MWLKLVYSFVIALKGLFKSSFLLLTKNVGKSLKCILIKFELSASHRFQDITVQNYGNNFALTSVLPFCQYL